ncbi:lipase-like domain-containing protein [Staphylococcus epidermidis]
MSPQYPFNQPHTSPTNQLQKPLSQLTPLKHNCNHPHFLPTHTSQLPISKQQLQHFSHNIFQHILPNQKLTHKQ